MPANARPPRSRPFLAAVAAVITIGLVATPLARADPSGTPDRATAPKSWDLPVGSRAAPGLIHAFDPPPERWLAGHRGVDLRAFPGEPVRAPATGTISYAGRIAGRGVLVITHEDSAAGERLRTSVEPVIPLLGVGKAVRGGQTVAVVEDVVNPGAQSTVGHCAPDTCLHWGVRRGEDYIDPLALLDMVPIVLLPA